MARPKEICCCGAYSWAKVIGVIQVFLYTLALALQTYTLTMLSMAAASLDQNNYNNYATEVVPRKNLNFLIGPIILLVFGIIFSIVGIVTGVLLIKGANQSNTKYLTIWMIFAAICYGFKIIEACMSSQTLYLTIIGLGFGAVMYGFGVWAVFVLKREIEADTLAPWAAYRRGTVFPMTVKA